VLVRGGHLAVQVLFKALDLGSQRGPFEGSNQSEKPWRTTTPGIFVKPYQG
jgi:hypothetical protein